MKIKSFKRTTSKLIFAGLMLNLIATSLPLHAIVSRPEKTLFHQPQSPQEAKVQRKKTEVEIKELQRWVEEQEQAMQRKKEEAIQQKTLQRADINQKITHLKKRLKQMKKVRLAMLATLGTIGLTIGIIGAGVFGSIAVAATATGVGWILLPAIGGIYASKALALTILFGGVGSAIALGGSGLFAALSSLWDIGNIKKTVRELKQIELMSPGTLTEQQKRVIVQLTNFFKGPIIRGISQAIAEKKALDSIVKSVLKNNPQLAQSLGKKASKRLSKHIQWNWQLANFKGALRSLKKWNPKYPLIVIREKITKKQLENLHKKHQELKSLQQPVNEFTNDIKQIRAGFAKIK